jgi:hypothetical protein
MDTYVEDDVFKFGASERCRLEDRRAMDELI